MNMNEMIEVMTEETIAMVPKCEDLQEVIDNLRCVSVLDLNIDFPDEKIKALATEYWNEYQREFV